MCDDVFVDDDEAPISSGVANGARPLIQIDGDIIAGCSIGAAKVTLFDVRLNDRRYNGDNEDASGSTPPIDGVVLVAFSCCSSIVSAVNGSMLAVVTDDEVSLVCRRRSEFETIMET
jgi:hypothetical protein